MFFWKKIFITKKLKNKHERIFYRAFRSCWSKSLFYKVVIKKYLAIFPILTHLEVKQNN